MNGKTFDKIVSKLSTVELTSNTLEATKLPDDFEPKDLEINKLANAIR